MQNTQMQRSSRLRGFAPFMKGVSMGIAVASLLVACEGGSARDPGPALDDTEPAGAPTAPKGRGDAAAPPASSGGGQDAALAPATQGQDAGPTATGTSAADASPAAAGGNAGGPQQPLRPADADGVPRTTTMVLPYPEGARADMRDLGTHAEFGGTIHGDSTKNWWAWIPPGVKEIKAIYFNTELFRRRNMKPILIDHGMAIVKVDGPIKSNIRMISGTADTFKNTFLKALRDLGQASKHPELENAPIFASCHAQDAPWCKALVQYMPERTIGHMQTSFNTPYDLAKVPPTFSEIPYLAMGDTNEFYKEPTFASLTGQYRAALGLTFGAQHFSFPLHDMVYPYLDQLFRMRVPADARPSAGPVALKPLARESGWLHDSRGSLGGKPGETNSYAAYTGNKEQASWLPNKYLAYVMQGYNTQTPNVKIVHPTMALVDGGLKPKASGEGVGPYRAGSSITLKAEGAAGVTEVTFYDGDIELGVATREGNVFSKTVTFAQPGVHAILAQTTGGGTKLFSRPALIFVVR